MCLMDLKLKWKVQPVLCEEIHRWQAMFIEGGLPCHREQTTKWADRQNHFKINESTVFLALSYFYLHIMWGTVWVYFTPL